MSSEPSRGDSEPRIGEGRRRRPRGILKPKAVDRGSADSPQVGVVGLVIVGSGLAKMAGDRGVNDAGLKASTSESSQYWQVIATGALDDDDQIFQAIASDGLAENSDGFVESGPIVFDDRGRDEGAAVEVGHHPLRAGLGAVNGDDAEVLGTDFLNPWRKDAGWIAELAEFTRTTGGAAIFAWTHGWILRDGVDDRTNTIWESHWQQSRRDSSLKELLPDISQTRGSVPKTQQIEIIDVREKVGLGSGLDKAANEPSSRTGRRTEGGGNTLDGRARAEDGGYIILVSLRRMRHEANKGMTTLVG